jgi:hypothetical protein
MGALLVPLPHIPKGEQYWSDIKATIINLQENGQFAYPFPADRAVGCTPREKALAFIETARQIDMSLETHVDQIYQHVICNPSRIVEYFPSSHVDYHGNVYNRTFHSLIGQNGKVYSEDKKSYICIADPFQETHPVPNTEVVTVIREVERGPNGGVSPETVGLPVQEIIPHIKKGATESEVKLLIRDYLIFKINEFTIPYDKAVSKNKGDTLIAQAQVTGGCYDRRIRQIDLMFNTMFKDCPDLKRQMEAETDEFLNKSAKPILLTFKSTQPKYTTTIPCAAPAKAPVKACVKLP